MVGHSLVGSTTAVALLSLPAPCTAAATWTKQSNTVILIAVEFVNH